MNSITCSRVFPGNCSRTWSIEISPLASFVKYLLRTLISLAVNLVADVIFLILSLSSTRVPFHSALFLSSLNNFLYCLLIFPLSNFVLEKKIKVELQAEILNNSEEFDIFLLRPSPLLIMNNSSLTRRWEISWSFALGHMLIYINQHLHVLFEIIGRIFWYLKVTFFRWLFK